MITFYEPEKNDPFLLKLPKSDQLLQDLWGRWLQAVMRFQCVMALVLLRWINVWVWKQWLKDWVGDPAKIWNCQPSEFVWWSSTSLSKTKGLPIESELDPSRVQSVVNSNIVALWWQVVPRPPWQVPVWGETKEHWTARQVSQQLIDQIQTQI